MPFTPFHLGPGLLLKAAAPRRISFTAFAITQVLVDIETLYHLMRHDWPPHQHLHSVVGGSAAGLFVAGAVAIGRPAIARHAERFLSPQAAASPSVVAETNPWAAIWGGLLGGATHALLDGMFHSDGSPWWPFITRNNLYGVITPQLIQTLCVVAGLVAVAWLWQRERARSAVA